MDIRDELQEKWSTDYAEKCIIGYKKWIFNIFQRVGKIRTTLLCIDKINIKNPKILVTYFDNSIRASWEEDIVKFGYNHLDIHYVNHASLSKVENNAYDVLVLDECFSGNTEILTEKGFIEFKDLKKTDLVAQWEEGYINFIKPLNYIKREHKGEIVKVHLRKNKYLYLTENHNHPMINRNTKEVVYKKIKDWDFNYLWAPILSGKYKSEDTSILSPLENLYIILQADRGIYWNKLSEYTICIFSFSEERKIEKFLKTVENSGMCYNEIERSSILEDEKEVRNFVVKMPVNSTRSLRNYISLKNNNLEKCREIIEEMVYWSGRIINKNEYYFFSVMEDNINFCNEIATLANYSCYKSIQIDSRSKTFDNIYSLYISSNDHINDSQVMNKENVKYDDYVYCVTVPSGNIVIRSEGVTLISGNCHTIGSENRVKSTAILVNSCPYVIGLSGTITAIKEKELKDLFDLSILMKYDKSQAIKDGIVADYSIEVVITPLDNVIKTKNSKGKLITEFEAYRNLTYVIENINNSPMLIFKRNRLLQQSVAKRNKIKNCLKKYSSSRIIIFTGYEKTAESLSIPFYHGKCRNTQSLNDFNNLKFNHLALAVKGQVGVTYNNLDIVILSNFVADSSKNEQGLTRSSILDYGSKVSKFIIICTDTPTEIKKLNKTLAQFDNSKIKYIYDV